MSMPLTPRQVEEFEEAFSLFDKDEDGTISTNKLGEVMRSLGQNPTEKLLQDVINEIDEDETGSMGFSEFLHVMVTRSKDIDIVEEIKETFQYFSKRGNGYVSEAELKEGLAIFGEELTEDEIKEMIREADADQDGQINAEEFIKIVLGD